MSTKYVRCDSHCKYPAYSADEVDGLFYKKENFAILTGNTVDNSSVEYPEGFNKDNCVVIGSSIDIGGMWLNPSTSVDFETSKATTSINVILTSGYVRVFSSQTEDACNYKVILMKVGE